MSEPDKDTPKARLAGLGRSSSLEAFLKRKRDPQVSPDMEEKEQVAKRNTKTPRTPEKRGDGDLLQKILSRLEALSGEVKEVRESRNVDADFQIIITELRELRRENAEFRDENRLLKENVRELTAKVDALETRCNDAEQYSRRSNLVIEGVPQTRDENTTSAVLNIGRMIHSAVTAADIDISHRLPGGKSIVVKFVRREAKSEFLRQSRSKFNLTAGDLGFTANQNNKIFIREHLTRANGELFYKARQFKRSERNPGGSFKYVWTREGHVYMRADDGAPVVQVRSDRDLPGK